MNKIPPNAPEVEKGVLGAMLTSESAFLLGIQILKEEDFYRVEHRKIFRAIVRLFERKSHVDTITLSEELEREGALDEIGGRVYIDSLQDSVISPSLIKEHSAILLEKSIYRKVIAAANEIVAEAYREDRSADELLDWAEQRILDVRQRRLRGEFRPLGEVAEEVFGQVDAMMADREGAPGILTGFEDLDKLTVGFREGNMIILASRPSVGKTSFMLNIHHRLSVQESIPGGKPPMPTAIFTLEMGAEQLVMRSLALEARVDSRRLQTGKLSRDDLRRLTEAVSRLKTAPVFLDDTPAISLSEIRAKARRIVKEERVGFISVDYMQLIRGPRSENRQQEVSRISQGLKALARELNIPIMVLSQLSRASEQREEKTPRLSDLRESGSIEQDADMVIFLHRPEIYQEAIGTRNRLNVLVSKNRNGPTGKIQLTFLKEFMRFESFTEEDMVETTEYGEDLAF